MLELWICRKGEKFRDGYHLVVQTKIGSQAGGFCRAGECSGKKWPVNRLRRSLYYFLLTSYPPHSFHSLCSLRLSSASFLHWPQSPSWLQSCKRPWVETTTPTLTHYALSWSLTPSDWAQPGLLCFTTKLGLMCKEAEHKKCTCHPGNIFKPKNTCLKAGLEAP